MADKVQVDFLGPFSVSTAHEYRYALQIQDILSRYVVFVPTTRNDAETASVALFEEWVCKFGFPMVVQSDRGTHFSSRVFEHMCERNGMKHVFGSTGHAQSQGCVERQNQLVNQVRALCNKDINKWPSAMLSVQYAHNVAKNESTGLSPYEVMFGQTPRTPESLLGGRKDEVIGLDKPTVDNSDAKSRLKDILVAICTENTRKHQKTRNAKLETRGVPYKVGELVRLKLNDPQKKALGGKKIAPRNSETYEVVSVSKMWTYKLMKHKDRHLKNPKLVQRHYNELVPCLKYKEDPGEDLLVEVSQQGVPETIHKKQTSKQREGEHVQKPKKAKRGQEEFIPLPSRRSKRARQPPERLVVDHSNRKRYDSVTETYVEEDDGTGSESSDSQC